MSFNYGLQGFRNFCCQRGPRQGAFCFPLFLSYILVSKAEKNTKYFYCFQPLLLRPQHTTSRTRTVRTVHKPAGSTST
jgi:hypothetical protein